MTVAELSLIFVFDHQLMQVTDDLENTEKKKKKKKKKKTARNIYSVVDITWFGI